MPRKKNTGSQPDDEQAGGGASSNRGLGPQSPDALIAYIANLYQISNGQVIPQEMLNEAFHYCMEEGAKRADAANDQTDANTQLILAQVRWIDAHIFLQIAESRRKDERQAAELGTREQQDARAKEELKRSQWGRYGSMFLAVAVFLGSLSLTTGIIGGLLADNSNNPLWAYLRNCGGGAIAAGIGTPLILKRLLNLIGKSK